MRRLEIVIATRNPKKFQELKVLLTVPGVRWRSLRNFPSVPTVPERGRTFTANAVAKARAAARATGYLAVADDSGLEVEALDGAPGIRSARFAGRHGADEANNRKLLRVLKGLPPAKRGGQYRCVLALAGPRRVLGIAEGTFAGRIAVAPKGRRGFGYDPLFVVPQFGKTVAQLPAAVKHRISHRAKAAVRLRRRLARLVEMRGASAVPTCSG